MGVQQKMIRVWSSLSSAVLVMNVIIRILFSCCLKLRWGRFSIKELYSPRSLYHGAVEELCAMPM